MTSLYGGHSLLALLLSAYVYASIDSSAVHASFGFLLLLGCAISSFGVLLLAGCALSFCGAFLLLGCALFCHCALLCGCCPLVALVFGGCDFAFSFGALWPGVLFSCFR